MVSDYDSALVMEKGVSLNLRDAVGPLNESSILIPDSTGDIYHLK